MAKQELVATIRYRYRQASNKDKGRIEVNPGNWTKTKNLRDQFQVDTVITSCLALVGRKTTYERAGQAP